MAHCLLGTSWLPALPEHPSISLHRCSRNALMSILSRGKTPALLFPPCHCAGEDELSSPKWTGCTARWPGNACLIPVFPPAAGGAFVEPPPLCLSVPRLQRTEALLTLLPLQRAVRVTAATLLGLGSVISTPGFHNVHLTGIQGSPPTLLWGRTGCWWAQLCSCFTQERGNSHSGSGVRWLCNTSISPCPLPVPLIAD